MLRESNIPSEMLRRVRSFVRRDSRKTTSQKRALNELWPIFGISIEKSLLNFANIFQNNAPCFVEIGFGSGQSLLELAKIKPEFNFVGVETHKPGIGALLLGIELNQLQNIRIINADAVDVFRAAVGNESLAGIQIFFPDPWPKRRHHVRRLIQKEFISEITQKLQPHGSLHLATDWQDYAKHMMQTISQELQLINVAGIGQFAERSPFRPLKTKFESRALRDGRAIWELQFLKR